MKKSPAIILAGLICIMLIAAGCTSSSGTTPATTPAATTVAPMSPVPSVAATTVTASSSTPWSGTWNTLFDSGSGLIGGTLTLTQTGSSVTGIQNNGTINATVQGSTLTGTWLDRPGFGNNKGLIKLVISEDANSFTGTWASASGGMAALENSTRTWNGVRTVSSSPSWFGTWNSSYSSKEYGKVNVLILFNQAGSSVTGTYNHGNGTINASVQGNKLSGTWVDSDNTGTKSGFFEFEQSTDEKSFTGRWVYTPEGAGAMKNTPQFWNGVRI